MTVLSIGLLYAAATLVAMFVGMPIALALGAVATAFMIAFMPSASVDTIAQNVYEEMASITLLSIPLFILKGAAIGRSRAGQDLYGALHVWMHRIPGGLGIANIFACALFAAMGAPRRPPARQSAQPEFRNCASAAIPVVLPQALSLRAGRSASCCRRRSP
jgi:C4-dicarboxylate transporter, DctM subunit